MRRIVLFFTIASIRIKTTAYHCSFYYMAFQKAIIKQTICILVVVFGFLGCNSQTTTKEANVNFSDTLQKTASADKQKKTVYIKDPSKYDQSFIEGLSEYNEPLQLIDNYILVENDTVYFPEDLQLKKETVFKGIKDFKSFILSVKRTNLTSLQYNFELFDNNKLVYNKAGKASIESLFFLGAETDEDDQTGDGYLSIEYWDYSSNCTFSIRIGEKDENGKLRAKIKLDCQDDKIEKIDLEDNPTLRTE